MTVRQTLAARLANLEHFTAKIVQVQQPQRAAYERNFKQLHEDAARVLSAQTDSEIDLAKQGLVPRAAQDPEAVALANKLEREREAGQRESTAASTAAHSSDWQTKRREILAARAKLRRECEVDGRAVVFASDEPPVSPPSWFLAPVDGRVTHHKPALGHGATRNADGTRTLDLADYDAVAGRPVRSGPPALTAEAQFALAAKGNKK